MKQQFIKEKTKEVKKQNKYVLKGVSCFFTIAIVAFITLIIWANAKNEIFALLYGFTGLGIMAFITYLGGKMEGKIEKTILKYVEEEINKKINEMFISYKGRREEDVNYELEKIVFSEVRPTQEEIDRINKTTKALNELQEDKIIQGSYLFREKLEKHIENLHNRKYSNEELDTEFEEKQKQRLERIIQEHDLKLNTPPTDESMEIMLLKCCRKLNEQNSMRLYYEPLNDITEHLRKIVSKKEKIKEEEKLRISSVVSEILWFAKEYEKTTKMQIKTKIEEKLAHL